MPPPGGCFGINILIPWGAVIERGYASQNWLTFRQAMALRGPVRKGEHGTTIVHADRFIPKDEKERAKGGDSEPQAIPYLKRFTVFNVTQCDGLPEHLCQQTLPLWRSRILHARRANFIHLPPQPAFFKQINCYRTCFHEHGHHADAAGASTLLYQPTPEGGLRQFTGVPETNFR